MVKMPNYICFNIRPQHYKMWESSKGVNTYARRRLLMLFSVKLLSSLMNAELMVLVIFLLEIVN